MILKASQRGGAKQLGLHLLKMTENERVEIHEVRGFISDCSPSAPIGLVTVLRRSLISLCHLCFERQRADATQI